MALAIPLPLTSADFQRELPCRILMNDNDDIFLRNDFDHSINLHHRCTVLLIPADNRRYIFFLKKSNFKIISAYLFYFFFFLKSKIRVFCLANFLLRFSFKKNPNFFFLLSYFQKNMITSKT